MKSIILISIILLVNCFNIWAGSQDEYTYSKLFEEGKTWEVVENWYDFETHETTEVHKNITVDKDWSDGEHRLTEVTIFNMKTSESNIASFLEENKVIYTRDYNCYLKIIDFNLRKGDAVYIVDAGGDTIYTYYVVNDEVINIQGINRRIISIGSEIDGKPFTYWIEGVGAIHDYIMLVYPSPTCGSYLQNRRIVSCHIGDQCIFSYEDMEDYISSSEITSPFNDVTQKYSLSYNNDSINIKDYIGSATLNVYSFDGTLCISESVEGDNAVSTSSLPTGLYLVRAILDNGFLKSSKFIKR